MLKKHVAVIAVLCVLCVLVGVLMDSTALGPVGEAVGNFAYHLNTIQ